MRHDYFKTRQLQQKSHGLRGVSIVVRQQDGGAVRRGHLRRRIGRRPR
jgi:hypothetical protein